MQTLGPIAAQEALAADGIDQDAAGDAPSCRAQQRLNHLVGLATHIPDVEFEMASVLGRVDVANEGGECFAGVVQEPDLVAGQGRALQQRFAQSGQSVGAGRQLRVADLPRLSGGLGPTSIRIAQGHRSPPPVLAEARLADEEVDDTAHEGEDEHDTEPGKGDADRQPAHDDAEGKTDSDQQIDHKDDGGPGNLGHARGTP